MGMNDWQCDVIVHQLSRIAESEENIAKKFEEVSNLNIKYLELGIKMNEINLLEYKKYKESLNGKEI